MIKLQSWFYKYNAWSFTKHRLWGQCKLAYYLSYIGTALQESRDFNVSKLKELKKLDSRFVLQGKLVHEIVENQIGQCHLGHEMDEEAARAEYIDRVEEYRNSANRSLIEYLNGETVKESFFDKIREDGLDQLSMFFGVIWPQLSDLQYLRHEEFDRFKVNDIEAIVKVDYACKTGDGQVFIYDWKTGADNPEYENDLQIGAYVLWAMQHYKMTQQQVKSMLVYLSTGTMRAYEFSSEQLEDIRRLVISDFKEMNSSYDISYFIPNPDPRNCLSCHFASVCPHSVAHEQLNR